MRILGLDVGDRTIGVAVSDPLGFTAQGVTTIRRRDLERSLDKDIEALKDIIEEYGVGTIVCGLPKNMNGTIGPQGEKAIEFGKILEEKFGIKVEMWDERLTTMAAHRAMIEADMSRKKRKQIVDKLAATYILQGYMDRMSK